MSSVPSRFLGMVHWLCSFGFRAEGRCSGHHCFLGRGGAGRYLNNIYTEIGCQSLSCVPVLFLWDPPRSGTSAEILPSRPWQFGKLWPWPTALQIAANPYIFGHAIPDFWQFHLKRLRFPRGLSNTRAIAIAPRANQSTNQSTSQR